MAYDFILLDITDKIATITLNRPKQLNALSEALLSEYVHALKTAEDDPNVRAVIVKGAGPGFCAGYDAAGGNGNYAPEDAADAAPFIDDKKNLDRMWGATATAWNLTKPVIAQVHGYCVAGGNDIAGQCDVIIAADNAIIQQPQVRRLGLSFNHMYPYKIGPQWSKILLLSGDPVSGKEAEQLGLVAMSVPEEELEAQVLKLAKRFTLIDPTMMATNKMAINRAYESMGLNQARETANTLDTVAHVAPIMQKFVQTAMTSGFKAALTENEAPFKADERPFKVPGG
ncbi:crotonase/enoyl-CoA hydratase family protein [Maricurvus nonylphenolicus]|uniref:enoyl-CoA hydratase-related protein n=1 Tax=Maricurvus nonylphenolicus TaxID=1008307 RepID=UPI0036F313EF